jgi:cyclopropane fatty-acyl-phospholipid synthase-like methyltransferase
MADSYRPSPMPDPFGTARAMDFDTFYATSTPPWDIGRPQPAFADLASTGQLHGQVLDVGCGTGEHVLLAASLGFDATGIDTANTAITRAQKKAQQRGLTARFLLHDALELEKLGEQFDTVLDCGLFHIFTDTDRPRFANSLANALRHGGRYHMLCFSDRQPGTMGPRRVSQAEIRDCFTQGWHIDSIKQAILDITTDLHGVQAWLATITRT